MTFKFRRPKINLDQIDFDIIVIIVLIWSMFITLIVPNSIDTIMEVVQSVLLAYFGFAYKKKKEKDPENENEN